LYYVNQEVPAHGFIRNRDGVIRTFDAPGALTINGNRGTFPASINAAGDVAGWYWGPDFHLHGFVLARKSD
jgi:hypothetical protein